MKNVTGNSWLGLMVGLGAGQAILAMIYKDYLLAELFLIWPLLLPVASGIIVMYMYKKLGENAPKTLISLFIFFVLIGISLLLPIAWSFQIEKQHETLMVEEVPPFPSSILLEQNYYAGDGFNNEPGLTKKFKLSDDLESIGEFYKKNLLMNGWRLERGWENIEETVWFTKRNLEHHWGVKIRPIKEEGNFIKYEIIFSIYQ